MEIKVKVKDRHKDVTGLDFLIISQPCPLDNSKSKAIT
jgi:hypothetical protein